MNTANKNAVITGANSGIGLALTHKLLAEGYNVFGTSRSGRIDDLHHDNLRVIRLDITDRNSVNAATAEINTTAKKIDLLINNAGVAPDVFAEEPEIGAFMETFSTNVYGTVFFTETVLPILNSGAQVIFISSNMSLPRNMATNGPAYRMSKAAINVYAMMLAQRLENQHIRVTPVHPGWVQTRLGGDQAPYTTERSAEGIFKAIQTNEENGKFWNVMAGSIEPY
ncbi:SDR family NAD(P)-dependent oxidoreductase [Chitinophaga oryziterrae]|uniref:SDR family NAD(P)-dependent oxidoreductase n=1 Tax=Chitinophaga oryziterrae TaxID=1031224 RepID=A0A6N8JAY5_9BACT|nr:SDR family NAD(P)-dependent oxidoreductase [Chitinophaga oryziterrae]MVT42390.1 SDR family NAD(P)-dependent oxidoreductase [Chitinophaga oryziterrae]